MFNKKNPAMEVDGKGLHICMKYNSELSKTDICISKQGIEEEMNGEKYV